MRTIRLFASALVIAAVIGFLPATSDAQETATDQITARATILAAIQVAGLQDLDFQFLLRGVDKVLGATAAEGGVFAVSGTPFAEVSLDFAPLPGFMTCTTAVTCTTEEIPLVSYTAAWSDGGGTVTAFTPPATAQGSHPTLPATGVMEVLIGATAQPTPTQASGQYEATIALTAAYTGN